MIASIGLSIFRMITLWLARLTSGRFFFNSSLTQSSRFSDVAAQCPYAAEGSRTLVEDARAVLNGDADLLLGHDKLLADVDGIHGIDQDIVDAVALYALDTSFARHANGRNMTAYTNLPLLQAQPQVLAAPVVPPVINQVLHIAVTAPLQCPYGCIGTFRRREEYRRHMKKHTGPFFPCTHPNCGKMFYRQDKLRDHLAKGH